MNRVNEIKNEVKKAITGKDLIIERVLNAILAGGHILIEDIPGVGKTTLALALSKALGLSFGRVQFTPDVVPSDITGFSIYDKETGNFHYREGAILKNFFLADEINRTSSKTQSALLEVMQENKVTVDGEVHRVPEPFVVIATQNPVGTAGTQMLPEAQLDRFMIKLSIGYPDEKAQVAILKNREGHDPLEDVTAVVSPEEVVELKAKVKKVYVDDKIYEYITRLCQSSREDEYVKLGISPRGALSIAGMAKGNAFMSARDYVVPEDVQKIFVDTTRHRLVLQSRAGIEKIKCDTILERILENTKAPKLD